MDSVLKFRFIFDIIIVLQKTFVVLLFGFSSQEPKTHFKLVSKKTQT